MLFFSTQTVFYKKTEDNKKCGQKFKEHYLQLGTRLVAQFLFSHFSRKVGPLTEFKRFCYISYDKTRIGGWNPFIS